MSGIFRKIDKIDVKSLFFMSLGLHFIIWAIMPWAINENPPLDVIEAIVWGRELMWGYPKHPPLAIFLTQFAYLLGGKSAFLIYVLSQVAVISTLLIIWKLASEFVDEKRSILAAAILQGIFFFNYTTPEFNPNVLQMPLWAAICLLSYYAIVRGNLKYWIGLGIVCGLAFITKYFAAILFLCLLALLFFTKEGRKYFVTTKPYVAFFCFLLVIYPHVVWIINSDFLTLKYAAGRTENNSGLVGHFILPLRFALSQAWVILFACLIFIFAAKSLPRINIKSKIMSVNFKEFFLLAMGIGPFILLITISLIFGMKIRSMWGMPIWNMLGIIIFFYYEKKLSEDFVIRFKRVWAAVFSLAIFVYAGQNILSPYFGVRTIGNYPGDQLADIVTEKWRKKFGTELEYVGGLVEVVSNVAVHSKDNPEILTNMRPDHNPWIEIEDVYKKGAVVIWDTNKIDRPFPQDWLDSFPGLVVQSGKIVIPDEYEEVEDSEFIWAVIPPSSNLQLARR